MVALMFLEIAIAWLLDIWIKYLGDQILVALQLKLIFMHVFLLAFYTDEVLLFYATLAVLVISTVVATWFHSIRVSEDYALLPSEYSISIVYKYFRLVFELQAVLKLIPEEKPSFWFLSEEP